jgi:hypothetical protein
VLGGIFLAGKPRSLDFLQHNWRQQDPSCRHAQRFGVANSRWAQLAAVIGIGGETRDAVLRK